jgi:glucosamine-6-phosphate deaminase
VNCGKSYNESIEEKENRLHMKIIVAENYSDLSRKTANLLSAQVIIKPNCVLGLATGSTPLGTYAQLIDWYNKGDLDFLQVKTVNLDEYVGLPATDAESYAYYMKTNFFDHINIDQRSTYLPNGIAENIEEECRRYDQIIRILGGIDMQLLGVGLNGHVGFNEPGEIFMKDTFCVTLTKNTLHANARFFEREDSMPHKAITVGIRTIMQARRIVLSVSGSAKSEILYRILAGSVTPQVPASILQLHSNVTVVADRDAMAETLLKEPDIITRIS